MKKVIPIFFVTVSFLSINNMFADAKADAALNKDIDLEDFDDLDLLDGDAWDKMVDDAIKGGVLKPEIEFPAPTKAQIILAKFGSPFLNMYSCIVKTWRNVKTFFWRLFPCMVYKKNE